MKNAKTLLAAIILLAAAENVQAQIGKLNSLKNAVTTEKKGSDAVPKPSIAEAKPTAKYSEIKAGMTDADIEEQALDLVNKKAANEKWKEKYTQAKIVSEDWEIEKNEYTGAIKNRKIRLVLYGVWPDGKCKSVDFSFLQNYDGAGYQKSLQYVGIGDMTPVICE